MATATKDIVVGCITNYNWAKITHWVNSLDRSGFSGDKVMLCYDIDYSLVRELEHRNYIVFGFQRDNQAGKFIYYKKQYNICLDRFFAIPMFLRSLPNQEQYRYLITTDVRDVVFQSNPSTWLEQNLGDKSINVASESLTYRNEPWGRQNIELSFGPLHAERLLDKTIYNAGTLSGKYKTMLDLCDNIYLACGAAPEHVPGGGGPDQAALNLLLDMEPYKAITNFCSSESGYAAQLGTTADPSKINAFRPHLLDPEPQLINDLICTSTGLPFCIVHQYDRVPKWNQTILKKYE